MTFLSPADAARRLGVSAKALRLYEERGLSEKEAERRKSEAASSSAAPSTQVMASVDAMRQRFARARTRSKET